MLSRPPITYRRPQKYIVSFSGGKDSTAMLLLLLEKELPIDEVIFCDTGMEFPEMYTHLRKVERAVGVRITRVSNPLGTFKYYMLYHEKKKGGSINRRGYGWPLFYRPRWCTRLLKESPLRKYLRERYKGADVYQYVGIAFDEYKRWTRKTESSKLYPLVEWRITEREALRYCYERGFDWDGLYTRFERVSCWCCPFQSQKDLFNLYCFYPNLWEELRQMDRLSFNKFKPKYSVDDLSERFEKMLTQMPRRMVG